MIFREALIKDLKVQRKLKGRIQHGYVKSLYSNYVVIITDGYGEKHLRYEYLESEGCKWEITI
jgi:hypothetical protein